MVAAGIPKETWRGWPGGKLVETFGVEAVDLAILLQEWRDLCRIFLGLIDTELMDVAIDRNGKYEKTSARNHSV
jgi:hypothetical protein